MEHEHARRFAALALPDASHPLLLGWRSDGIEPRLVEDPLTGDTWIGVDEGKLVVALMDGDEHTFPF